MRDMDVKAIIGQIAKEHGVSYDEVYADMKEAILEGFHSKDPEARKLWSQIEIAGDEPTPEEVIMALTLMLTEPSGLPN